MKSFIKMKGWILGCLLLSVSAHAFFTIGPKNINVKNSVHKLYFITPHNESLRVRARIFGGHWDKGRCHQDTATSNIGYAYLQTGDFVEIEPSNLKALIGSGYSCLGMFFIHAQKTTEIVRLNWQDGQYQSAQKQKSQILIN